MKHRDQTQQTKNEARSAHMTEKSSENHKQRLYKCKITKLKKSHNRVNPTVLLSLLATIINLFPTNIGRASVLHLPCQNNIHKKYGYESLKIQSKISYINSITTRYNFPPQVKTQVKMNRKFFRTIKSIHNILL